LAVDFNVKNAKIDSFFMCNTYKTQTQTQMASLPIDIAGLYQIAVKPEEITNNINDAGPFITCQCADDMTFMISKTNLVKHLKNPVYTGMAYTSYRSVKIATWFNSAAGVFEGELMFMNHQMDILRNQDHALFDNIYYKYLKTENDIGLDMQFNNANIITDKTFKLRDYVREKLMQSVDAVLEILRTLPITDEQFNAIAEQFQLFRG
jgi:hypothetical protein